ncbi:nucleoid-associated protein [Marinobacter fonticola]|uniref:nucleoid-associated protein n=1 Tax=Marinobacter fonticola TaxID=2603215 RepID=UPI0011E8189A|nr:nucleoid-associated protein [Marinobacter fonticola]
MQKSAVVRFGNNGAEDSIVVIDHSSGRYRDASQHFANFLDIKRALGPTELTVRLEEATVEAIKSNPEEVPDEVRKAPKRHIRVAMERMDGFDHEKPEEFLGSIVQGLAPDSKLIKSFKSKLKTRGLETEVFRFEGAIPPAAEYRRVITKEGVAILFNKKHEENEKVLIQNAPRGGVTITIHSTGLDKDDDLEKLPRIAS